MWEKNIEQSTTSAKSSVCSNESTFESWHTAKNYWGSQQLFPAPDTI